jgi:MOSC domain-containing protein YiiM
MEVPMSKNIGKILTLFISDIKTKTNLQKKELSLDTKGIHGDKYYNRDIQRSLLITSLCSYTMLESHHIYAPHGSLGENLLIDYNPYHLLPGTQLKIGSVILEISQYCTICNHLSSLDKRVPKLLKNDRGIFAKIIQEGHIKEGDLIFLLD